MTKQVIIGFSSEGRTDTRFLESVIQRSFESVAFECTGQIEILPVIPLVKCRGSFIECVKNYSKQADEKGISILCVHTDADNLDDNCAFRNKIIPAFCAVKNLKSNCFCKNIVAIVPVQMIEAWMLADKELLKLEINTSKCDGELGIDSPPETFNDPKQTIESAIRIARQDLPKRRRKNLNIGELYLPIGQKVKLGKLERLKSYQKFKEAIRLAFNELGHMNT